MRGIRRLTYRRVDHDLVAVAVVDDRRVQPVLPQHRHDFLGVARLVVHVQRAILRHAQFLIDDAAEVALRVELA